MLLSLKTTVFPHQVYGFSVAKKQFLYIYLFINNNFPQEIFFDNSIYTNLLGFINLKVKRFLHLKRKNFVFEFPKDFHKKAKINYS